MKQKQEDNYSGLFHQLKINQRILKIREKNMDFRFLGYRFQFQLHSIWKFAQLIRSACALDSGIFFKQPTNSPHPTPPPHFPPNV